MDVLVGVGGLELQKISVIIPCFNVEAYIDRCLESVMNQTIGLERLEVILVNDASTDSTLEKLYQWERRFPENIMVVTYEQNIRQGGARNIALQYATGEYIGFVDADDWIAEDMYRELYEKISTGKYDVVRCKFIREHYKDESSLKGISFEKDEISLTVGDTCRLEVILSPSDAEADLEWDSSNIESARQEAAIYNKYITAGLTYDNATNFVATLEIAPYEYESSYTTDVWNPDTQQYEQKVITNYYYYTEPLIVFTSDGSRFSLEDYFTEENFGGLIESFENLYKIYAEYVGAVVE